MKSALMNFIGVLFLLTILASIAAFATIIILDRWHRSHPNATNPMPKPVPVSPDPVIYEHDVKG